MIREFYAFLIFRPNVDKQPWPCIFSSKTLAEDAKDRCTPVQLVRFESDLGGDAGDPS